MRNNDTLKSNREMERIAKKQAFVPRRSRPVVNIVILHKVSRVKPILTPWIQHNEQEL